MMAFSECIATGDRFLAWYLRVCRRHGQDAQLRSTFDRGWDRYTGKHGNDWDQRAVAAIWMYVAASLGFRRKYRERMCVWLDDGGHIRFRPPPWIGEFTPPVQLRDVLTTTDADYETQRGLQESVA